MAAKLEDIRKLLLNLVVSPRNDKIKERFGVFGKRDLDAVKLSTCDGSSEFDQSALSVVHEEWLNTLFIAVVRRYIEKMNQTLIP